MHIQFSFFLYLISYSSSTRDDMNEFSTYYVHFQLIHVFDQCIPQVGSEGGDVYVVLRLVKVGKLVCNRPSAQVKLHVYEIQDLYSPLSHVPHILECHKVGKKKKNVIVTFSLPIHHIQYISPLLPHHSF